MIQETNQRPNHASIIQPPPPPPLPPPPRTVFCTRPPSSCRVLSDLLPGTSCPHPSNTPTSSSACSLTPPSFRPSSFPIPLPVTHLRISPHLCVAPQLCPSPLLPFSSVCPPRRNQSRPFTSQVPFLVSHITFYLRSTCLIPYSVAAKQYRSGETILPSPQQYFIATPEASHPVHLWFFPPSGRSLPQNGTFLSFFFSACRLKVKLLCIPFNSKTRAYLRACGVETSWTLLYENPDRSSRS